MEQQTNRVVGDELSGFIERIERLNEEKKAIQNDIKVVFAEAKSAGYDAATMRAVIRRRAAKPHDVQEADALLDMYLNTLGMASEPPLFRYFSSLGDSVTENELVKALGDVIPPGGEIVLKTGDKPVRIYKDRDGRVWSEAYIPPSSSPTEVPANRREPRRTPQVAVPDVDEDGAEEVGRQAYRDNQPITSNPFPWNDKRRQRFDQGWRDESGTDGMGEE